MVIELAPHSLLQAVLKRSLPTNCTSIGLMNKKAADNQIEDFLQNFAKIYQAGVNIKINNLYPQVRKSINKSIKSFN